MVKRTMGFFDRQRAWRTNQVQREIKGHELINTPFIVRKYGVDPIEFTILFVNAYHDEGGYWTPTSLPLLFLGWFVLSHPFCLCRFKAFVRIMVRLDSATVKK
jgi:hypothetical protein